MLASEIAMYVKRINSSIERANQIKEFSSSVELPKHFDLKEQARYNYPFGNFQKCHGKYQFGHFFLNSIMRIYRYVNIHSQSEFHLVYHLV